MKVGIDARLLGEPVTGIGRYTAELAGKIVSHPGKFYLYCPMPIVVGQWRQTNVALRTACFHSRIGKMVWSQTYLPYWAAKDGLDVFWGATHRLPRYLSSSVARVVTIHDLVWRYAGDTMRPLSRWVEKRLMPQAIRLADRIIADSMSTASGLEAVYPEARGRVRVIYPGATDLPNPLDLKSLTVIGIDRPYFLFVGTREPRKNLRRLLNAYARIDETIRNKCLMVIAGGKGWGGMDIHALAKEKGLLAQLVLTGYVNDKQLATLYANARFLAMPSIYEGFGFPLVEAMSFGVPVLTSNCSSMPEVAGDAGLLVDPLDEKAIYDNLRALLTDDHLRDTLSARAHANAARFSWQKAAAEAIAVFKEAVAERRLRKRHAW